MGILGWGKSLGIMEIWGFGGFFLNFQKFQEFLGTFGSVGMENLGILGLFWESLGNFGKLHPALGDSDFKFIGGKSWVPKIP